MKLEEPFTAGQLAARAAIAVAGPDARSFLHGLLTADIAGLKSGEAVYGALLSPQGKLLFDMFVLDASERLLIDCSAARKADLLKRLAFYKLRANVTLAEEGQLAAGVSAGEPPFALRYRDPRWPAMGWRFFAPKGTADEAQGYDAFRIASGLADSDADLGSGEFFPHEANLDQLQGVSFSKGCYVGQEVVSRMEHRGTARSRILPVRLVGPAPAKGTEVKAGDRAVGQLLSSAGDRALALVRLDRLAEAREPLLTEGVRVEVLKPAWARYGVPGAVEIK
jgi:hypothetical protein